MGRRAEQKTKVSFFELLGRRYLVTDLNCPWRSEWKVWRNLHSSSSSIHSKGREEKRRRWIEDDGMGLRSVLSGCARPAGQFWALRRVMAVLYGDPGVDDLCGCRLVS